MLQKPTVGSSVHFYNESIPAGSNNGIGHGPYHAVIVQVFEDSLGDGNPYVNLAVTVPFDRANPIIFEGSVKLEGSRRYEWPPIS